MKKNNIPSLLILTLLVFLTACTPPRGAWTPSSEDDDIGYYFRVSDDGTYIRVFAISPWDWKCGNFVIRDYSHIYFTQSEYSFYQVDTGNPFMVTGRIAPIEKGRFTIEVNLSFYEFDPNDFQSGSFTFSGKITSSSKASGNWELNLDSGVNCNGTWNAVPIIEDKIEE